MSQSEYSNAEPQENQKPNSLHENIEDKQRKGINLTTSELLYNTNWELIKGKVFSEPEKHEITKNLLSDVSDEDTVKRFHKSVKAPDLTSLGKAGEKHKTYPLFYIAPDNNGKKFRLITGELPKTHLLASNHYELEILRILAIFDQNNPKVKRMIDKTIERLEMTCFAHGCTDIECVSAGVSVLRFLSAVQPRNEEWINEILIPILKLYNAGRGGTYYIKVGVPYYYLMSAIPEIANEVCLEFARGMKDGLIKSTGADEATKSCSPMPVVGKVNYDTPDEYAVERWCVCRNILTIFPEYKYLNLNMK